MKRKTEVTQVDHHRVQRMRNKRLNTIFARDTHYEARVKNNTFPMGLFQAVLLEKVFIPALEGTVHIRNDEDTVPAL